MRLLLGPELLWGLIYGIVTLMAKSNTPPTPAMDKQLENLYLYIPLAGLLTFALWLFPGVEKQWLLLRVWITCLVVGHFALSRGLGAHSEQGPGIGTAYLVGLIFLLVALGVGSFLVGVRFLMNR